MDTFELWYWRRVLRVPWRARRSNQSIQKKINPVYSVEGLMLELKLQYFGHLRQRANLLEKTLMLRKTEGRRRRGWQRMRWLDGITNSMATNLGKLQEMVKYREAWHSVVHGVANNWNTIEQLNNSGLPSGHVQLWELGYKESWMQKNWFFWTVVLETFLGKAGDQTSQSYWKSTLNTCWKDWC